MLGVVCLLLPMEASAHTRLLRSTPSSGAHLGAAPASIRLEFSERPEMGFTSARVVAPDGSALTLGAVHRAPESGSVVVFDIVGPITAGTYRVLWQTAAADGHPARGSFEFTIAPGAMGTMIPGSKPTPSMSMSPTSPAAAQMHHDVVTMPESGAFGADSPVYVIIRWLEFAALLVTIGAVAFKQLVLGFLARKENPDSPMIPDAARRAARLGHSALLLLALTAGARLLAQSFAMHGSPDWLRPQLIGEMVANTTWGIGWLIQLLGLVIALVAFHKARGPGRAKGWWRLGTAGAIILAFTPAFSGHASSSPKLTAMAILFDGIHVLSAGGWLGSLLMVVLAGIPAAFALTEGERGPMAAEVVNAFSPTALAFAAAIGMTGVFAAWLHIGSVSGLWQTQYGKTLLIKLAILSVVAVTGAYNWLRVKPHLGTVEGASRIRRSATIELGVGVLVILVTAVLVALPTGADATLDIPASGAAASAGR